MTDARPKTPETVERQGEAARKATGDAAGNGTPPTTDPKLRKNIGPNGPVLNVGNPGNKGGTGRPSEKVRIEATESLQAQMGKLTSLYGKVLDSALSSLESGKLHDAMTALREGTRVAKTLTDIGPGTKVTNVVERDGYHDAASRAYDQHDGTKLGFLEALKAELDAIP